MTQGADETKNVRKTFAAGNPGAHPEELHCLQPPKRKARRLQERLLREGKFSAELPSPCSSATLRKRPFP